MSAHWGTSSRRWHNHHARARIISFRSRRNPRGERTPAVLRELKENHVRVAEITLHVGYGTFEPVRVDDIAQHRVLSERFTITRQAASVINECRRTGGRVVAVGTTTTRALESSVSEAGEILAANALPQSCGNLKRIMFASPK